MPRHFAPPTLAGSFGAMARNNAWCNHRLLAAIATLEQAAFDAPQGGSLGPAALAAAQAAIDRCLVAHCDALSDADLAREIRVHRGQRFAVERQDRLLLHLFLHQTHHRGQAHGMLSSTSVKPPQLDEFYSIAEVPLREAEFFELGWTEAEVWGR